MKIIDKLIDEDKYVRAIFLIILIGIITLPYYIFTKEFWKSFIEQE